MSVNVCICTFTIVISPNKVDEANKDHGFHKNGKMKN